MCFHQKKTGERAKKEPFTGTYLVTTFSYEGAVANRMRYDHFEEGFMYVLKHMGWKGWKAVLAHVKPKEVIAKESELDVVMREIDVAANDTSRLLAATKNPKCTDDTLVEFTNNLTATRKELKRLMPLRDALEAEIKVLQDRIQPTANIDEQLDLMQKNPHAKEIRIRLRAEIVKLVSRIGLVFGFNPDSGKEITATITLPTDLLES